MMLSERPYLQGEYQRERTSALTWLLSALIGGFLLQVILSARWFSGAGDQLEALLGLSIAGLSKGWVWTLLSHSFLHRPEFIFHALGNCLALFFLGRELIPLVGTRRFLGLYGGATVIAGMAWAAVHWGHGGDTYVGATAGVLALLLAYARFSPDQPLNFLFLFIFPVTVRPRHIAWALAGFDLLGLLLFELPRRSLPFDWAIASSAHLAGMITGYVYHRYVHHARWFNRLDRPEPESTGRPLPSPGDRGSAVAQVPDFPAGSGARVLRAEVDRILDKINSHGLSALTAKEREVLASAKRDLSPP